MKLAYCIAALTSGTFALPTVNGPKSRDTLQQITDTLLFVDTIDQFEAARNAQDPPQLDWSSDGCTDAPNNPLGFDFLHCCHRHDFGYRNYKAQDRFTADGKASIDSNFRSDMYNVCATYDEVEKVTCRGVADVYYEAVHEFGSRKRQAEMLNAQLE